MYLATNVSMLNQRMGNDSERRRILEGTKLIEKLLATEGGQAKSD